MISLFLCVAVINLNTEHYAVFLWCRSCKIFTMGCGVVVCIFFFFPSGDFAYILKVRSLSLLYSLIVAT